MAKKNNPKRIGIIGDPVAHSLSPAMHNAAFRKLKLPYHYQRWRVPARGLAAAFKKIVAAGWEGFNVTIPHKETIIKYLDDVEGDAKQIGAINTVVKRRGRWIGYNTDVAGYRASLKIDARFRARGKKIVVLGAGGASHAVGFALLQAGCKELLIVNRNPTRAKQLARLMRRYFPKASIDSCPLSSLAKISLHPDLLVNTTSVGLGGTRFPFSLDFLQRSCVVSDLVYHPRHTPLLREARRRGMKVHEGWGMLLRQGALAFQLWTGRKPPLAIMQQALLSQLTPPPLKVRGGQGAI